MSVESTDSSSSNSYPMATKLKKYASIVPSHKPYILPKLSTNDYDEPLAKAPPFMLANIMTKPELLQRDLKSFCEDCDEMGSVQQCRSMRINHKSIHSNKPKEALNETANRVRLARYNTIRDHNASSNSPSKLVNRTKINFQIMRTLKTMSSGKGKKINDLKETSAEIKILKQGHIWKLSNGKRKGWSKAYCVLRGNSLLWTQSYENKRVKGCIQFDLFKNLILKLKDSNTFMYYSYKTTRIICGSLNKWWAFGDNSKENIAGWCQLISEKMAESKNSIYLKVPTNKFWKVLIESNTRP